MPGNGPNWHLLRTEEGMKEALSKAPYSDCLKEFVMKCVSSNPEIRPSIEKVKKIFRTPSENERVWLRHLRKFLENKTKEYNENCISKVSDINNRLYLTYN